MNQTLLVIRTIDEPNLLLFWVLYSGVKIEKSELFSIAKLVIDEVDQIFWIDPSESEWSSLKFEEVQIASFKSGVTDNPAFSFKELLAFHPLFNDRSVEVHSGVARLYQKNEKINPINPLIQEEILIAYPGPKASELNHKNFITQIPKQNQDQKIEYFALKDLNPTALESMSIERFWALSQDEMQVIQNHYGDRKATDVEMEIFAQTWSEHCKHKVFSANINYVEDGKSTAIKSLFKTYIQNPTFALQKKKDWAISVFSDNAGIVRFHESVDLCIKVETHNSPSALDPYGGALTGILGVNRDILGTGLGARPIANTNVLLFGNPKETETLPGNLFHPSEVLKGVHRGIQDGGNKSGIPTVNGAMLFHESFSGKPLVFCGTIGVLPQKIQGLNSASKNQRPGDLIVMAGGAVGLDGIHGATSSSLALDHTTPSSMVQIGDPLTQKRLSDFLLEARDLGFYNSLTDNGAGGLSSSIGEMALQTGGARVELDQVPLKYPGLKPWQIFVSESQERMTFSVPKEHWEALSELAKKFGVVASVVGEFTDSGFLKILYHGDEVGKINLDFLHNGLPKMELKAHWSGPRKTTPWKSQKITRKEITHFSEILFTLASDPSLASKEKWVRQYDHEVQSATVIKPFEGDEKSAPNDGGLIWMGAHGNPGFSGAVISSGICPEVSEIDPKIMAIMAADEAVRNAIVTGADPNKIALIDNFCWPDPLPGPKNPDAEQKLAELVRTCQGLEELVSRYEMPLISGKDSVKNDYIGKLPGGREVKISVLPTLLVTALSYHPDVRRAIKPHALGDHHLYLLGVNSGQAKASYFGTTLPKYFNIQSSKVLDFDLLKTRELYQNFYLASERSLIQSAHDVSEGGVLFALFEMLMLNSCGIDLKNGTTTDESVANWFGEEPGRLIVSVHPKNVIEFEGVFNIQDRKKLGITNSLGKIEISTGAETQVEILVDEIATVLRNSV